MKTKQFIALCLILPGALLTACSSEVSPHGEEKVEDIKLSVNQSSITFDANRSATIQVNASKDVTWEASTPAVWINLGNNQSGTGSGSISLSVSEDNPTPQPRTGVVTISSSRYNLSATVQVTQAGTKLTVNPTELVFLTSGGSRSMSVESNASWYIASKPSWVELNVTDGNVGTHSITLKADANPESGQRSGELVIETSNKAVRTNVPLKQDPVSLEINIDNKITVGPAGTSRTIDIKCNSTWSANSSDNWCKVSPSSGTDNGTISLTVDEHTGNVPRTATLTISSGKVSKTISVEQSCTTLSLEGKNNYSFTSAGGSETIIVKSNTNWIATSNQEWCSISTNGNSGDGSFTMAVSQNSTITQREAIITVKALGLTEQIRVSQEAGVVKPGDDDNTIPQYSKKTK